MGLRRQLLIAIPLLVVAPFAFLFAEDAANAPFAKNLRAKAQVRDGSVALEISGGDVVLDQGVLHLKFAIADEESGREASFGAQTEPFSGGRFGKVRAAMEVADFLAIHGPGTYRFHVRYRAEAANGDLVTKGIVRTERFVVREKTIK